MAWTTSPWLTSLHYAFQVCTHCHPHPQLCGVNHFSPGMKPSPPPPLSLSQDTESLYLVMDFHPGGDLLTVMERHEGGMKEEDVRCVSEGEGLFWDMRGRTFGKE